MLPVCRHCFLQLTILGLLVVSKHLDSSVGLGCVFGSVFRLLYVLVCISLLPQLPLIFCLRLCLPFLAMALRADRCRLPSVCVCKVLWSRIACPSSCGLFVSCRLFWSTLACIYIYICICMCICIDYTANACAPTCSDDAPTSTQ